jgi:hypothetical protein
MDFGYGCGIYAPCVHVFLLSATGVRRGMYVLDRNATLPPADSLHNSWRRRKKHKGVVSVRVGERAYAPGGRARFKGSLFACVK